MPLRRGGGKSNVAIKYFSMFTGVGGFELGLQQANNNRQYAEECGNNARNLSSINKSNGCGRRANTFTCIGFSEIDKYANQLLKEKYPDITNYGDATKINPSELPDFDMLCGGFPCQSFSIAGKRRGFEDTRGTMFFEIARILEVKRPKIVFLENVKGLLNHNKGETFKVIIQTLSELGYDVQWMVLNSKFFGVSQNRERVFIIGNLRGEPRPEILPFGTGMQEIISESEVSHTLIQGYGKIARGTTMIQESQGYRVYGTDGISCTLQGQAGGIGAKTGLYAIPVLTPDRENKRQNGRRFKENGDESFTLTGQDIHGVMVQDFRIRRLTPLECERLQGFPDNYTQGFSDTQRYKMMGNAVTTNVIREIAKKLTSYIQNQEGGTRTNDSKESI
jgi:DNA (cytosine-5)-methyltransferase 1